MFGCHTPPTWPEEGDLSWHAWVTEAYAPLDDAGVIIEESKTTFITQHESDAMACGGSYSCKVGWRKTKDGRVPLWISCEVETEPSVWSCIHFKQPRPRFRFALHPAGRLWSAESAVPETPWLDAVLDTIRNEKVWHTFQICKGVLTSKRYLLEVLGWFDGDDDWSNRSLMAVLGEDGAWRATWVPRRP